MISTTKSKKASPKGGGKLEILVEIARIQRELRRGDLSTEERSSLMKKRSELEAQL